MSKLLLSFTSTLFAIRDNRLKERDLADAIFYFGCSREHAVNPASHSTNELEWVSKKPRIQERVHRILVDAIEKAEQDGRIVWRKNNESNSFAQLNALLSANNYKTLDFQQGKHFQYSYPTIQQVAKDQKHPLEVLWRN